MRFRLLFVAFIITLLWLLLPIAPPLGEPDHLLPAEGFHPEMVLRCLQYFRFREWVQAQPHRGILCDFVDDHRYPTFEL
ncbi:MAG: hypothetical protein C0179_04775 [Fervidicoccus sp.]|nr:MAG: hypothetical protein C0179_04775 [Fervidicoccus sp.]